jgi:hypothetical protein
MRKLRSDSGQVFPLLTFVLLAVLLAVAALVVDLGARYVAHRHAQSIADSAALAGAYDLPDESAASAAALQYATQKNGAELDSAPVVSTNSVTVVAAMETPLGFLPLSVAQRRVHASATATAVGADSVSQSSIEWPPGGDGRIVPIAISDTTYQGFGGQLEFGPGFQSGPGKFGLLALPGQAANPPALARLIRSGYDGTLAVGQQVGAASGNKLMAGPVQGALATTIGVTLIIPVYSGGAVAGSYTIVGFAAFRPTAAVKSGGNETLYGSLVEVASKKPPKTKTTPNYGVRAITLTG